MSDGHCRDYSKESQSPLVPSYVTAGLYEGTPSGSGIPPLNCNWLNGGFSRDYWTTNSPLSNPYVSGRELAEPAGSMHFVCDIDCLYRELDYRKKRNGNETTVVPQHIARRRAQNRASQRAFRIRKEKRITELTQRLEELEARHSDLCRSYESLQSEYSGLTQELDKAYEDNARLENAQWDRDQDFSSTDSACGTCKVEVLSPYLFGGSDCFGD